jgi:hypothetical protein
MSRLKSQKELTKTADVGGENLGGSDGLGWEVVLPARR